MCRKSPEKSDESGKVIQRRDLLTLFRLRWLYRRDDSPTLAPRQCKNGAISCWNKYGHMYPYGHMKLSAWTRQQGLSYKTAWRLWKAGKLPAPAEQLATGTVILHAAPANEPPGVALYARVSSGEQKADLDRQLSRLAEFSAKRGFRVVEAVRETGSGLQGRRQTPFASFP